MRGNLFRGAAVIAALSLAAPPLAVCPDHGTDRSDRGNHIQCRAPRRVAGAGRAVSGCVAGAGPDGVDLSLAGGRGIALARASPATRVCRASAWRRRWRAVNWDPSVKSLVPFPQVVATLNSQLEWMQQLGYAFATQQADVMASVQRLRHQAQASRQSDDNPSSSAWPRRTARSPSSRQARRPSTCRSTIRRSFTAPGQIRRISRCIFRRRPTIRWTARSLADLPLEPVW